MTKQVKWAAEIAGVREVSLLGSADLDFWVDRLRSERLFPAEKHGRAQVLVISAEMKFMGVWFREVSFSIQVRLPDQEATGEAAFLGYAVNTSRFFAWSERVFFGTPYSHGQVEIESPLPCLIQWRHGDKRIFEARMSTNQPLPREPIRMGDESWYGPIFLPTRRPGQGQAFIGKLEGATRAYSFLPDTDSWTIHPSDDHKFLQALLDSQLTFEEWIIRESASHAKSKTYPRARAPMHIR
jgi:hypothetical protein